MEEVFERGYLILNRNVRFESHYLSNRPYYRTVVAYEQLKSNREWQEFIGMLPYIDSSSVRSASEAAGKAFWMNAYNALAIEAVARNYPLADSGRVTEYPTTSLRGNASAWGMPLYIAGATYSFAQLEEILLEFEDPRVILGVSTAAHSSPALPKVPYTARSVEYQLDEVVQNFCTDPVNVRLDRAKNTLYISELFKRHAALFRHSTAAVPEAYATVAPDLRTALKFIWPHLPEDSRRYISARKPQIRYLPFLWELNERL